MSNDLDIEKKSVNNKYFANQTSNILYQIGHHILECFRSFSLIGIFTHSGSHSGMYRLNEFSQVLFIDVIIKVSKYLDLAKFLIATTK